jgi:hypothetical protein
MRKISGSSLAARRYQTGLGALGWLIVLAIISFGLTCFFKLGPVYLDYWNTKKALDVVVGNGKTASMSKEELQRAVQNQFDVSMINTIHAKDIKVTESHGKRELDASYEKRVSLIANIDVVVKFDQLKYTLSPANE